MKSYLATSSVVISGPLAEKLLCGSIQVADAVAKAQCNKTAWIAYSLESILVKLGEYRL